jgi:hypothetical protein
MMKLASITLQQSLELLLARGFFENYSEKLFFSWTSATILSIEFDPVEGLVTSGGNG